MVRGREASYSCDMSMDDAPDHAGSGEPPQLPPATPATPADVYLQQQWWDWWWRTHGYQAYGYGPPYAQQPRAQQTYAAQPYSQQPYAQQPYAPCVYPQDELPPRRRHRGLAALLVLLLMLVVVVPAATSVVWFIHDLDGRQATNGADNADIGPLPSGDRRFKPSAQQRAYFLEIGPIAEKGTRVAKWTRPTVRVAIVGLSAPTDRTVVNEILATVNRTIDKPLFVYARFDPQVTISFLSHSAFQSKTSHTDDTIGWCESNYTVAGHTITDARISIDDDPEFRGDRGAVLYHEFGHALGLDDTHQSRYSGASMYFRVNDANDFTRLDLAAIRMLYDGRTQAGATYRELVRAWPQK